MARRLPSHIQVEDLIGAGFLGLADALHRFDGANPDRFEAYADFRIRGAIMDELRAADPLSRDLRDLNKRMVIAVRELTVELGRQPDEIEIARKLELPLATFRNYLAKLSTGTLLSLDTVGADETLGIEVGDPAEPADSEVLRSERRGKLVDVMGQLPERLQSVLQLYYVQDYTLREIGETLGLTESRVCQLHSEAIVRLRAAYLADDDHDEDLTSVRRIRQGKPLPEHAEKSICRAG